ncbi:MAG: alpha-ketoacid dehydrogenase subunit beta [Deltaproteobacteria bacterium]|nr:alpha-ketoacid dehydrogenase subunit beta [Deltaproteobacteria bacterium]
MREVRYTEAVREALQEEMRRDERVIVLGTHVRTAIANGGITAGLLEEFGPERVMDTPVAEAALAGIAAGAAVAGYRPFIVIGSLGYALSLMDQVCNQAAKMHYTTDGEISVPVTYWFETSYRGWGVHHAQAIHALWCHLPGLKVAMPSLASDAKGLTKAALRDDNPVAVIAHPNLFGTTSVISDSEQLMELGTAKIVRQGSDITLVACGWFMQRALEAAEKLAVEGVSAEVLDLRSLVPLDWATLTASAEATGRVIVYDQGHRSCGIAVTVAAGIQERAFRSLKAPVVVVATADVPIPFNLALEDRVVPTVDNLVQAAKACLSY